ncbi:MAG TPA: nuclear transport factor 2 family protein [Gemmatimonadales bacterium]|jgi:ketosteroid isomerase-like protein
MSLAPGRSLIVTALFLGFGSATHPADAQTGLSDSVAIHEAGRQFSAAYMRGDVAALSSLYTADAVIFPERSDAITGQEAIRRYWTPRKGGSVTRHQLTPTRVVVDGKHAYDYGTYEVAGERDGKSWGPFAGKYLVVWRREPAGWRIQLDMWNSGPEPGS